MDLSSRELASSAIAGLLGTTAFGLFFMGIGNTGTISTAIPALYGLSSSLTVGWAIHLFHGAVLGIVYALIVDSTGYGHHLGELSYATGWGLAYGVVTSLLLAAVLMPFWLGQVGAPVQPPLPNISLMGLAGHVIYGGVLGVSYPVIRNQLVEE